MKLNLANLDTPFCCSWPFSTSILRFAATPPVFGDVVPFVSAEKIPLYLFIAYLVNSAGMSSGFSACNSPLRSLYHTVNVGFGVCKISKSQKCTPIYLIPFRCLQTVGFALVLEFSLASDVDVALSDGRSTFICDSVSCESYPSALSVKCFNGLLTILLTLCDVFLNGLRLIWLTESGFCATK